MGGWDEEACQSLSVLGARVCWNIKWLEVVSSLMLWSWLCIFLMYLLEGVVIVGGSNVVVLFCHLWLGG